MRLLLLLSGLLLFVGCVTSPSTKEAHEDSHSVAVGRAYYEAYNRRDIQAQLNLMADDIIYVTNSGRTLESKASYRKYTEGLFEEINEKTIDLKYYLDPSQSVLVARGIAEGKYEKASSGMPPARGQKYSIPFVEIFEIANGKIKKFSTYYNEQLWSEQIKKQ